MNFQAALERIEAEGPRCYSCNRPASLVNGMDCADCAPEVRDLHRDERCDERDGSCNHRSITECVASRVGLGR